MSELRIPPDQSEHLPPYFERNAADVKPEEWPNAANRLPPRMADLVERLGRLRNDAASTRYFDPPVNATTHTGRAGIYP
jgi:hypothetical protein